MNNQIIENMPSNKLNQFAQLAFMALGGAVCGLFIFLFMGLSIWWAFFLLSGLVVFFVAISSGYIKRLCLLLIAFFLPMNIDIHFFQNNLRISISSLIILFVSILWIIELARDKEQKIHFFPRTTIPAVAFLLVTGVSLLLNGHGNMTPMFRMFEPTCDLLIYLYVANKMSTEKDVKVIVWALLLGALLQCAAAIAELCIGIDFDLNFSQASSEIWQQEVGGAYYSRISGLMEHANMLAIYLSSMIIFLISLVFCKGRQIGKVIYWLGVGIGFFVIVYTFSRSAWLVFSIFAPLTFLIYLWKLGSLKKAVPPLIFFQIVVTGGVLMLSTEIADRLTLDLSVLSRWYMIKIGINMMIDNPVFGVGLYNYAALQFFYDTTIEGITSIFPGYLHNIYVLIAAEQGVVGLLLFLWLNYAIWMEGWLFVPSKVSFLTNIGLSFFGLILMFFLFGMANPFPRFTYIYFALGMLVGINRLVTHSAANSSDEHDRQWG